jgi:AcrR family transcriptional regulator
MTASSSPAPEPSVGARPRRRDQILGTAAELFATKGYTRTPRGCQLVWVVVIDGLMG